MSVSVKRWDISYSESIDFIKNELLEYSYEKTQNDTRPHLIKDQYPDVNSRCLHEITCYTSYYIHIFSSSHGPVFSALSL